MGSTKRKRKAMSTKPKQANDGADLLRVLKKCRTAFETLQASKVCRPTIMDVRAGLKEINQAIAKHERKTK
jgi:hypothetical protein